MSRPRLNEVEGAISESPLVVGSSGSPHLVLSRLKTSFILEIKRTRSLYVTVFLKAIFIAHQLVVYIVQICTSTN